MINIIPYWLGYQLHRTDNVVLRLEKQRGNCFTIFKYLMGIASYFVCMDSRGCMLAEIDSRLFHTINHLGMKLTALSDPVYFLGSESIAAYALRDSIMKYYLKCISEYDYSFIKK